MKKTIVSTLAFLALVLGYLLYYHFYVQPKDIKNYESFIKEHTKDKKNTFDSHQSRIQKSEIEKEIWQLNKEERLHSKIFANSSEMFLKTSHQKNHFLEEMNHATCILDESVTKNIDGQKIHHLRVIETKKGLFDYSKSLFTSKEVDISFLDLDEKSLQSFPLNARPYLKGKAYKVAFSFKDHNPNFHALSFDADIDSKKVQEAL